jgi:hypothetical protein
VYVTFICVYWKGILVNLIDRANNGLSEKKYSIIHWKGECG